jgi:hypothetical protein
VAGYMDTPYCKEKMGMLKPGTYIKMTKGYKETKGVVTERTKSRFELYILKLNNGLNVIAGPSAFVPLKKYEQGILS